MAALRAPDLVKVADRYLLWLLLVAALYTVFSAVLMRFWGSTGRVVAARRPSLALWKRCPRPGGTRCVEDLPLQQVYHTVYATSS